MPKPMTFAEVIAVEERDVAAGAVACGHICECHGSFTCLRRADHVTAGIKCRDEHVGRTADGALTRWTVGDCPSAEEHAANVAQARADHVERTRSFLAGLDVEVLAQFLTARNGVA